MYNNNDLAVGYINLLNIAFVQILYNPDLVENHKKGRLICMLSLIGLYGGNLDFCESLRKRS